MVLYFLFEYGFGQLIMTEGSSYTFARKQHLQRLFPRRYRLYLKGNRQ